MPSGLSELEDERKRPPLVVLEDEPGLGSSREPRERRGEARACGVRIARARADVEDDLVRAVEAERREHPVVVLELGEGRVDHAGHFGRQHRVLPRMRRKARSALRKEEAELPEAFAELVPPLRVFAGCDANGIRLDVSRKTWIPWSRFQRTITSSASRFARISWRSRAGVRFASRSVRADDGSCVLTHA